MVGEVRTWGERQYQKQVDGSWKELPGHLSGHDVQVGGSYGSEADLGLDVSRYSDRAILIQGNTYANLDLLRKIKGEVGAGVFNKQLNGWVFPASVKDTVLGILASNVNRNESATAQEQKVQDHVVDLKNAPDVGTQVEVAPGVPATVTDVQVTPNGVEVRVTSDQGRAVELPATKVTVLPQGSEQAAQTLQNVTPESRVKDTRAIFGRKAEENEEVAYDRPVPTREYVTPTGERVTAIDLSEVAPMDLRFPTIDDILTKPVPTYIPPINEYIFSRGTRNEGFLLDSVPLGGDKYLVFLNGSSEYSFNVGHVEPAHAVMSLDNLVITMEHYRLKHKAKLQAKADERNRRQDRFWETQTPEAKEKYLGHGPDGKDRRPWSALPKSVQKKVDQATWEKLPVSEREKFYKPVKVYGVERMTLGELGTFNRSMFEKYRQFVDRTYVPPPSGQRYWQPDDKAGAAMLFVQEQLQQRRVDLRIQGEDQGGTYQKGKETSFGDANLQDTLLDELGVRVKAQDGSVIKPTQQEEVAQALREVYGSFGDRSELARNFGLKVSHAGYKHMHASTALGVYYPRYRAIGVGAAAGDHKFGFTLAHEFAHFLDHRAGNQVRRNFASDDATSTAGRLARTFRKHMNRVPETDYIGRSCECLARACEQYHALRTQGADAQHIDQKYVEHPNFVDLAKFEQHVKPLVEQFLKEHENLIKGAEVGIFEV